MGGEGARRTGSSASGRRGVGEWGSFELLRGKVGKRESFRKNLRFAIGTRLRR